MMEVSYSPNTSHLKAHKVLPRRKVLIEKERPSRTLHQLPRHPHEADSQTYKSSELIESWIPEPSPVYNTLNHVLPLTPPSNSREKVDEGVSRDSTVKNGAISTAFPAESSALSTPVIQRSPPTPEITPPRERHRSHALFPPPISRDPSSGADSFATAHERLSSDDESGQRDSPPLRPSRQKWLSAARPAKLKDIGLGLGLESEEEDRTPTKLSPILSSKAHDFVTFDGAWGSAGDGSNEQNVDEDQRVMSSNTLRKKHQDYPHFSTQAPQTPPKRDEEPIPSLMRGLSLRERVERSRHSPTRASTERFAEQIEWPSKEEDLDIDAKLREVDNRRFSQMSGTSTVVEAVVIDTPPRRRQTLRHTGRIASLNSMGSMVDQSNRSSLISNGQLHRQMLRNNASPDRGSRRSIVSDTAASMDSGLGKGGQSKVPVNNDFCYRHQLPSGYMSLTSTRQHSSRPFTAPDKTVGYFDLKRENRRTMPASLLSSTPLKQERRNLGRDLETPLVLSSSPSALLGGTFLTTASLTPGSFLSENDYGKARPSLQITEPQEPESASPEQPGSTDWAALRPSSPKITPFSLRSAHSSTPGTLEVSEATAISIYPHNNKSILVVQQMARRDSNTPEQSAIITSNANIGLLETPTPAMFQQPRTLVESPPSSAMFHQPRTLVDSPLQNPRSPPQPPALMFIPPTPANGSPETSATSDLRRHLSSSGEKSRLSHPISLVKRAFSTRRYSEPFISPLTRSLSRRNTLSHHRPNVGDAPDNKLHPFWRPRGFWDDLSDSDSEFGNDGILVGNTLGIPHKRVTSQSSSLSRRFSNSFRPKRSASETRMQGLQNMQRHSGAGMFGEGAPGMRYSVRFSGFQAVRARWERRRERRDEERRQRLRGKIGGVVLLDPEVRAVEWQSGSRNRS